MCVSKFLCRALYAGVLLTLLGCSKSDDGSDGSSDPNNFYSGAYANAKSEDLLGYWAIFEAEYEGRRIPIPEVYANCGRDFFIYRNNGAYQEYLYTGSSCETISNQLQWELDKGVISLRAISGISDDLVIIKLTPNEFYFKARVDIDEDGELDVVVLIAKPYTPTEEDFFTQSFRQDTEAADNNLIGFTWDPYDGFNAFEKYEIYRSAGENCSKSNAQLVATITDANQTSYIDLTPPANDRLCYFFRIHTDKGVLGESILMDIYTPVIPVDPVGINAPVVSGNSIELSWAKTESPYFSHYEVLVANYPLGTGASAYQEYVVATIDDPETTSFVDTTPPYLENPYYGVRVINIFGNYSGWYSPDVATSTEVLYKPDIVLPWKQIKFYSIDPEEPVVYFWAQESGDGLTPYQLSCYNYETQQVERNADLIPQNDTEIPIKVIRSPFGKELVVHQGIELHFYDAATMEYKYTIDPEGVFSMSDFNYFEELDIWVISDGDDIFTLQRDNANLSLIDSEAHFPDHHGGGRYEFITLKNNQIILGHYNETTSLVYTLENNGIFLGSQSVNIQFRSFFNNERILYNATADILLDTDGNRLYSSITFQYLNAFGQPNFPSGISTDGTKIFGTNNDPSWNIEPESLHKKEVTIYDRNTTTTKFETIGYPHVIFENYNGDIISISSGFKKEKLYQNVNSRSDLFIEKVVIP